MRIAPKGRANGGFTYPDFSLVNTLPVYLPRGVDYFPPIVKCPKYQARAALDNPRIIYLLAPFSHFLAVKFGGNKNLSYFCTRKEDESW